MYRLVQRLAHLIGCIGVRVQLDPPLPQRAQGDLVQSPGRNGFLPKGHGEFVCDRLAARLRRMYLEEKGLQTHVLQTVFHNVQSSDLLGDEEHRLPVVQQGGDHVRDCLGLARPRRTVHDEALPLLSGGDGDTLRGVRIEHHRDLLRRGELVDAVRVDRFEKELIRLFSGIRSCQRAYDRMRDDLGFVVLEVAIHRLLREREVPQVHRFLDGPCSNVLDGAEHRLETGDDLRDAGVFRGREMREVSSALFQHEPQRRIEDSFALTGPELRSGSCTSAVQADGDEQERAQQLRVVDVLPVQ